MRIKFTATEKITLEQNLVITLTSILEAKIKLNAGCCGRYRKRKTANCLIVCNGS